MTSRLVIDKLKRPSINISLGITLSLNRPHNNDVDLNIIHPAVLRQYFDKDIKNSNGDLKRWTFGSGTGTLSVDMEPHNYITRSLDD